MNDLAELHRLVKRARAEAARGSFLVTRAQKRIDKFKHKYQENRRARYKAQRANKPKKAQLYQRRQGRAKRKVHFWTKREINAIEFKKDWKAALRRRRRKLAAAQPKGGNLVATARKYIGVHEGGTTQRRWANSLGFSSYLPWCSMFVAQMMMEANVITKAQLPSNPAYSGAWMSWSHGHRISRDQVAPGDLIIYDWGDGGMSDHINIYEGGGRAVGGNQSDAVTEMTVPWGNVVAVIRVS